jgi:hypothetical protein
MSTETFAQRAQPGLGTDVSSQSVSPFLEAVAAEERRVDYLLACPGPVAGWFRPRWQKRVEEAHVVITRDITDPEFRKNLRMFRRLISETAGLYQRAECRAAGDSATELQVRNLGCRIPELKSQIRLPSHRPLTLKVLLGYRFTLEHLLIDVGDDMYVTKRAAALYAEDEGTVITWKELFKDQQPPLMMANSLEEQAAQVERTRIMVAQLLAAKEADDMPIRARRELKQRAFAKLLPFFILGASLFGYAIWRESVEVVLPAVAGMTGAALGMLLKLRDELQRGSQIREFLPFALAQLVVGATAGLFVSLVEASGVINLADKTTGVGAVSFVVGYSEAAFLGLVGSIVPTTRPSPSNSAATQE